MRCPRPAAVALCLVAAAVAPPVAAATSVRITDPAPGLPVHGRVTVTASIEATEPVELVLFFVDGSRAGERLEPPWRVTVDVGDQNADHEFRVVAYLASGRRVSDAVSTAAIAVDDTLDVELQQLFVTVTSSTGRVLGLTRDAFRILDEGEPQEIVTFSRGEVPITAVLLLDVSESMVGQRLEGALAGARAFVDGMRELDEAQLVLFSDRVRRSVPFTGDPARLSAALTGLTADGGTAVNDFLFMGLKLLDARQGRRVVVLFSDGADVHSVLPMREVVEKADLSPCLIYWIHLLGPGAGPGGVPSFSSSWRDQATNEREFGLLRDAVETSGGRVEILERPEEIEAAFGEIIAELREQYVLGYYPSSARDDGSWHKVKVKVDRPGVKVRSRGGYYDR